VSGADAQGALDRQSQLQQKKMERLEAERVGQQATLHKFQHLRCKCLCRARVASCRVYQCLGNPQRVGMYNGHDASGMPCHTTSAALCCVPLLPCACLPCCLVSHLAVIITSLTSLLLGIVVQAKARAAGAAALAKFEEKLQAKLRNRDFRRRVVKA
jgi:hypothetical protein